MDITYEDRLAIETQIYLYAYTFDSGDFDGFAAVFTDDGVFEAFLVGHEEEPPISRYRGTAELRGAAVRDMGPDGIPFIHHTSGIIFDDVDSTSPRTRATVIATTQMPSGPTIDNHGVYYDRWRKTPDGWRIENRRYILAGRH
jgi:hypothetical protein